jgi:hypothetical protein
MQTDAKQGLDPTPNTIHEGSVKMEQHPNYAQTVAELRNLGFELEFTNGDPYVEVKKVLNPEGETIKVEKKVYVCQGMRFLDLEHEIGHVRQLIERFSDKPLATKCVIEYPDGRVKDISDRGGVLNNWQNTVTEYHNRLDEFLRLHKRRANTQLLREHAQGIREWRGLYQDKGLKAGRSSSRKSWVQEHFPDIPKLEQGYQDAGGYERENSS